MSTAVLSYAIDEEDRLVRLDAGFYAFAEENDWRGAGDSLGRSLWDFVAGHELRKLQRMVLRRVRDERRCVELPFRCDGPTARREMEIRIGSNASGRLVLFSARLLREIPRERPQPVLDPAAPRGEEMLAMCGWCDRFLVDGEWVEVEVAASRLRLFAREELPSIDHRICPECSELLVAA